MTYPPDSAASAESSNKTEDPHLPPLLETVGLIAGDIERLVEYKFQSWAHAQKRYFMRLGFAAALAFLGVLSAALSLFYFVMHASGSIVVTTYVPIIGFSIFSLLLFVGAYLLISRAGQLSVSRGRGKPLTVAERNEAHASKVLRARLEYLSDAIKEQFSAKQMVRKAKKAAPLIAAGSILYRLARRGKRGAAAAIKNAPKASVQAQLGGMALDAFKGAILPFIVQKVMEELSAKRNQSNHSRNDEKTEQPKLRVIEKKRGTSK